MKNHNSAPYAGHLERGPDRIYSGPAIRLDLAGYGGAVELGFTGCTMAENPDAYAAWILGACNSHAALISTLEKLAARAASLDQSATHDGLQNAQALAQARALLDSLTL